MRLTIVHFRRRALRRRETRRAGSRMLKLRAALLVLAVAAAGCAEREAQLRDRFFPDGRQPVTEPPLVTIEDGVARAEPVTEAASIEVRIDAGPWRLYRGPISLAPDEEISARAQRYGWKLSDVVTGEVKGERKARAPLHP